MQRWLGQLESDGLQKTRLYVNSLASLAYVHQMGRQPVSALEVSRRVRALNEALGSEATLSSQMELDRQGNLLFQLGRFSEALEVDRETSQRFVAMEGGGQAPPWFVVNRAGHSIVGGDAADGEADMRSVLPKYEREGPEDYARGIALDLASAYVILGRHAEARSMLHRFEARLSKGPARPRERIQAATTAVEIALETRHPTDLNPALDALEAALTVTGVARLPALQGHLTAGLGRLARNDPRAARSHADRALELATAQVIDGQASAWVGAAQLLLARIALAEGDRSAARRHLDLAGGQFADTLSPDHRWYRAVASLTAKL
jgi:hypothetical protein